MKSNQKLISLLSVLLIAPAFLLACNNGGENPGPSPTSSPLKFTATQNGSSIGYEVKGSLPNIHIQYSLDDGVSWTDWTNGSTKVNLNNGQSVCVRNTANTLSIDDNDNYFQFVMDGEIEASDNISSMINNKGLSNYCFSCLFYGCADLTVAPKLPATTLAKGCYSYMFCDCESLAIAPELPANGLMDNCYEGMFYGCADLAVAPLLPATTLAKGCYSYMFRDCESLAIAPALSANELKNNCYEGMFYGCVDLTVAPELPAETLAKGCYSYMFCDCESLAVAPELPANELMNNCYEGMFYGCEAFTSAPELPATALKDYCYKDMFRECSNLKIIKEVIGTKIFTCPDTYGINEPVRDMFTNTGSSTEGTPIKYNTYYWCTITNPLKFTAAQDGSSISYKVNSTGNPVDTSGIQYFKSDGASWISWDVNVTIDLDKDEYVWVQNTKETLSIDKNNYFQFVMDGEIEASDNINSMINNKGLSNYCFYGLFSDCEALTVAPELPATKLAIGCYSYMFSGCTSLESAPNLNTFTLAKSCYSYMFSGCTSLESAPNLNTSTLAENCYYHMFEGCTALTSAPNLPATQLKSYCYVSMFEGCSSLKVRDEDIGSCTEFFTCPIIEAGVNSPVTNMFYGTIGAFSAGTPTEGDTYYWYL